MAEPHDVVPPNAGDVAATPAAAGDDLPPVAVVGMHGGSIFGAAAAAALGAAEVLVGAERHLAALDAAAAPAAERIRLAGLGAALAQAESAQREGRRVCLLASGDPGFYGIVRALSARLGPGAIEVHPAPSSVSLAFARLGMPWEDALVVSAHGRSGEHAAAAVAGYGKVAVLTGPAFPPESLGTALVERGCGPRRVWVCQRLGEADEAVVATDVAGLGGGEFDPLSVVVTVALSSPAQVAAPPAHPVLAAPAQAGEGVFGLPEEAYSHRAGMITKSDVRAAVLARLALPPSGQGLVLWDVGAGSGSLGVEATRLAPGLRVLAVERDPAACVHVRRNAEALAAGTVEVIQGAAPGVLDDLEDPDRVVVGGGGLAVVLAAFERLRPGGTLVATFATPGPAAAAAEQLDGMVQISVSRGVPTRPGGPLRLEAANPVFVVWGHRR